MIIPIIIFIIIILGVYRYNNQDSDNFDLLLNKILMSVFIIILIICSFLIYKYSSYRKTTTNMIPSNFLNDSYFESSTDVLDNKYLDVHSKITKNKFLFSKDVHSLLNVLEKAYKSNESYGKRLLDIKLIEQKL